MITKKKFELVPPSDTTTTLSQDDRVEKIFIDIQVASDIKSAADIKMVTS